MPPLLIVGENDHTFPAPLTRPTFRQYRQSKAVTGYEESPGRSHYSIHNLRPDRDSNAGPTA